MKDSISAYAEKIKDYDVLTTDEEQALASKIANGDEEALQRLICSNLRLVMKIAHDYKNMGLEFADIISAGNLGLIDAARRFRADKGARFGYFAQFHINHSIREELSKMTGAVSKSLGVYQRHKKIKDISESNAEATVEEISRESGNKKKTVIDALGSGIKVSLQDTINDDIGRTYQDVIENTEQEDVHSNDEAIEMMYKCLKKLDKNERIIIRGLFGLDGKKKVLREIGKELGVSAERVRQLKEEALLKLRKQMACMAD